MLFNNAISSAKLGNIDLSSFILNPHASSVARFVSWQSTSPEYRMNFPLIITYKFNDVHWIVCGNDALAEN
jgi:hypothetical protein